MRAESLTHARSQMRAHGSIDLRNQVQFDTRKVQQMLSRFGGRLDPDERPRLDSAMKPEASSEGKLEAIQMAWLDEYIDSHE